MFKSEIKDSGDITGKYVSAFKRGVNKRWEKKLAWFSIRSNLNKLLFYECLLSDEYVGLAYKYIFWIFLRCKHWDQTYVYILIRWILECL